MVATLDSTGARRETIRYSTYGLPFGIASGDVDGSGSVVAGDASAVNAQIGKSYGVSGYTVLLDVDLDGDVDVNDYNVSNGQSGLTLGHSALSAAPTTADGGNRIGYAGYAWEPVSSKYAVRHRVFDPVRGRWSRRDPVGYVDSPTLYAYVNDRAMTAVDPMGLARLELIQPEQLPIERNDTPKLACAPYVEMGAHNDVPNTGGCGMGGASGGKPKLPSQLANCWDDEVQAAYDSISAKCGSIPISFKCSNRNENGGWTKESCGSGYLGFWEAESSITIGVDCSPTRQGSSDPLPPTESCRIIKAKLLHELEHARQMCETYHLPAKISDCSAWRESFYDNTNDSICQEVAAYCQEPDKRQLCNGSGAPTGNGLSVDLICDSACASLPEISNCKSTCQSIAGQCVNGEFP